MAKKSSFPWAWVGCGCLAIVGTGLALIGVATFFGIRTAQTMSDPIARENKAQELLNAAAIPPDYDTELAISVPFFADLVVLRSLDAKFIWLDDLRTDADLNAAFDDEKRFQEEMRRAGMRLNRRDTVLAENRLQLGSAEVRYALIDGAVEFSSQGNANNFDLDDDDHDSELSGVFAVRCSPDEKPGVGLWSGPRVDSPEVEADGTDPNAAAFEALIGQFGFCR